MCKNRFSAVFPTRKTILLLYKSKKMYLWYSVRYLQVYSHMFCKVSLPYMGTASEVDNHVLEACWPSPYDG